MIRSAVAALFALCLSVGTSAAQGCGPYQYTLMNGQNADADQVMMNFNHILGCVNANVQGYISGLTLSNDPGSQSQYTTIDIAVGVATSDDVTTSMKLATPFSKNCNMPWMAGTGNGGLDNGMALTGSPPTWYHMFVIERTDTGLVDALCSTSATSPILPLNYNKKRRIGSFRTDSSARILAFTQTGDEFFWSVPVGEVNTTNPGTVALTPTLTVPTGVVVESIATYSARDVSSAPFILVTPLSIPDTPPSASAFHLEMASSGNYAASTTLRVPTDTSGRVRTRWSTSGASDTWKIVTHGWRDFRGQ
jgi:hypothetical protein